MNKTIILPMVWNKYGKGDGASSNEIRLGWRESNFIDYKYNSWVQFNVSSLLALNLRVRHIVSAKIVMILNAVSTSVSCRIHNVLKPATSGANWTTYNGTNSWTVAGGEGAGTDIGSQLTTHSNFLQTTVEIPLSAVALMETVVTSNGIFAMITNSPQAQNNYIVAWGSGSNAPYLEVVYNKPSTFDVVMF